jgi:hypothetical protein
MRVQHLSVEQVEVVEPEQRAQEEVPVEVEALAEVEQRELPEEITQRPVGVVAASVRR